MKQVDQQRRQPRARRDPHREDRREGHDRTDQHELVELVDVERHGTSWVALRLAGLDWILSADHAPHGRLDRARTVRPRRVRGRLRHNRLPEEDV